MNTYSISYITNSGLTILNQIEEAKSAKEVIDTIKGTEGVAIILSCVRIK